MVRQLLIAPLIFSCATAVLHAQDLPGDRTTIQYYRDNTLIGSDEYSIRLQGVENVFRSRVTVVERGDRITTEITFDRTWEPRQVQMDVRGSAEFTTHIQFGDRRITFRSVSASGETARELPRRGAIVLIDDEIPSLYAVLQHVAAGPVTLYWIRSARTSPATLIDHGMTPGPAEGPEIRLRHLELRTENGSHHAWFDQADQLVSVEIPERDIRASTGEGD